MPRVTCDDNPCQNDSECIRIEVQSAESYKCNCSVNWTGVNCHIRSYVSEHTKAAERAIDGQYLSSNPQNLLAKSSLLSNKFIVSLKCPSYLDYIEIYPERNENIVSYRDLKVSVITTDNEQHECLPINTDLGYHSMSKLTNLFHANRFPEAIYHGGPIRYNCEKIYDQAKKIIITNVNDFTGKNHFNLSLDEIFVHERLLCYADNKQEIEWIEYETSTSVITDKLQYTFFPDIPRTDLESEILCRSIGGRLPSIINQKEQDILISDEFRQNVLGDMSSLANNTNIQAFWLGAERQNMTNETFAWNWVYENAYNGEIINNLEEVELYSDWYSSDAGNNDRLTFLFDDDNFGKWDYAKSSASVVHYVLCEKKFSNSCPDLYFCLPPNYLSTYEQICALDTNSASSCHVQNQPPLPLCEIGDNCNPQEYNLTWIKYDGQKSDFGGELEYAVFTDLKRNWDQSRAVCEAVGGNLASILGSHEQGFIKAQILLDDSRTYWLGAKKVSGPSEELEITWNSKILYHYAPNITVSTIYDDDVNFLGQENADTIHDCYGIRNSENSQSNNWQNMECNIPQYALCERRVVYYTCPSICNSCSDNIEQEINPSLCSVASKSSTFEWDAAHSLGSSTVTDFTAEITCKSLNFSYTGNVQDYII